MKWQDVRNQYPESWVIIEALQAHDLNNKRIIDEIAVLDKYKNAFEAMKHYTALHKNKPDQDILVVNTINTELDITNQHWVGIRGNT